jgi:hypothetical protein
MVSAVAVEGDRWKKGRANENFDQKKRRNIKVYEVLSKATRQSTVAHSTDKHKLGTVGKG